jgi:hydroxymethylpyrimidine pyrophosphatase-like HAD family hydrolase
MQTIRRDQVIMVDIDGTLVKEISKNDSNLHHTTVSIPHPLRGNEATLRIPMSKNIQLIKDMHTRGRFIVVWSAGGYAWADSVVRALNLENFVDLVMEKPIAYVDDLDCQDFMGHRIFLQD